MSSYDVIIVVTVVAVLLVCYLEEEDERRLTDNILSGEVVETECEDDIVCPWCGTRYDSFDVDENHSFMDEGEHVTHCYECDHDFIYQADVSITFSTRRE